MNVTNTSTNAIDNTTIGAESPNPPTAIAGRAKVAIAFLNRSNDSDLAVAIGAILGAMKGNPHYPAPIPALADVIAARDAFVAEVNAVKGGPLATIARHQKRAQLVTLVRSLALYVQQNSDGDPLVLRSSGYPMQKARQPAGPLIAPLNLRLARGKVSGQLKARCNPVPGAGSYQWRYATAAAPTTWTQLDPTMAARIVLDGLAAGTQYVVQVRAVGTSGPGDWSDAASLMAV